MKCAVQLMSSLAHAPCVEREVSERGCVLTTEHRLAPCQGDPRPRGQHHDVSYRYMRLFPDDEVCGAVCAVLAMRRAITREQTTEYCTE